MAKKEGEMRIKTVFTCEICEKRIEYDTELGCYLKHDHDRRPTDNFVIPQPEKECTCVPIQLQSDTDKCPKHGKKKVYKYATGQDIPDGAIYLWSCKNGKIENAEKYGYPIEYEFVWHYFLVETPHPKGP